MRTIKNLLGFVLLVLSIVPITVLFGLTFIMSKLDIARTVGSWKINERLARFIDKFI